MGKFKLAFAKGSDGNGGSSENDKTYVYTVSGAGTTAVNGDYYLTDLKISGYPVYTNGEYYLSYDGTYWNIHQDENKLYNLYYAEGDSSTAAGLTWDSEGMGFDTPPAPTVTAYTPSDSSTDKTYVFTSEEFPDAKANGNWYDSGKRESGWTGEEEIETIVYTNDNGYEIFWTDDWRWNMRDATGNPIYAAWEVNYNNILDSYWTLFNTSDPITGKFIAYQG